MGLNNSIVILIEMKRFKWILSHCKRQISFPEKRNVCFILLFQNFDGRTTEDFSEENSLNRYKLILYGL